MGICGSTSPSTTGSSIIRLSVISPHRAGSGLVAMLADSAACSVESRSSGTCANASAVGSMPSRSASAAVTRLAVGSDRAKLPPPLWVIARWNSPCARGIDSSAETLIAPALSPNTVTWPGSPPNEAMLSRTHSSAATWSSSPRLATTPSSAAKPSTPKR